MYIQNRRDRCKFKGCSPLQNCNDLISLKPAITYFAYSLPLGTINKNKMRQTILLVILLLMIHLCYGQKKSENNSEGLSLDSLVENQILEKSIPSIAIGIVKDGKIILAKGYGYANVEDKVLANEHTIYQLGSVTKMFTGHLLAKFVNEQEISIADTLANFFPAGIKFPKSPTGQQITIKEIATHSSEFPRYPENLQRIDPDPISGYSKEELMEGIEMVAIDTVIGVRYNYSNFGYGVLGTAIENRMGESLSMLMEDNVFKPYDMNNTSLVLVENFKKKLAIPYFEVSPNKRTEPWDMGSLSGAGNVFSSISDLNKFMIQLLKDSPINKIQQEKYFRINETWNYGLGCFVIDSDKRNTQIIYHGGDIDGYASSLTLYPEYGLGFVILTNFGEGQVVGDVFTKIGEGIVNYYLGESVD